MCNSRIGNNDLSFWHNQSQDASAFFTASAPLFCINCKNSLMCVLGIILKYSFVKVYVRFLGESERLCKMQNVCIKAIHIIVSSM